MQAESVGPKLWQELRAINIWDKDCEASESHDFIVVVGLCLAQDANDWHLETQRGKVEDFTRCTTVVYEAAGDKVKVTIDGVGSDGKPTHNELDRQVRW